MISKLTLKAAREHVGQKKENIFYYVEYSKPEKILKQSK